MSPLSDARIAASLRNVSLRYGERKLFDQIAFQIHQGEWAYLVGPTGSGKSSLLRLLYADLQPDAGEIQVAGYDVSRMAKAQLPLLRRKLGVVFQDYQLLPDRSVYENIRFALRATGWRDPAAIKRRIQEVLIQAGISGKAEAMPHQLSGGEQQCVAIARALINDPLLIIADEPSGNLDPDATQRILEVLQRIHHAGAAVLMATHEYALIRDYPARVIEIAGGRLRDYAQGPQFLLEFGARLR
jgi:cell division transport system ATP-binding protein